MTIKQEAKDFEDNLISYKSQLEISRLNNMKDEIKFLLKAIQAIKEGSKSLLEKAKQGCGIEFASYFVCGKVCKVCNDGVIHSCQDCQEVSERLRRVLE